MSAESIYPLDGDHENNNFTFDPLAAEKNKLLAEIDAWLKKGDYPSLAIVMILVGKLNGMSNELTNGVGAYNQDMNDVQRQLQKVYKDIKDIEAYNAENPKKPISEGLVKRFMKDMKDFKSSLDELGKLVNGYTDPKTGKKYPPQHGPDDSWLKMYQELYQGDGKDEGGLYQMISGQGWSQGGVDHGSVQDMIDKGDVKDLTDALTTWTNDFNNKDQSKVNHFFKEWDEGRTTDKGKSYTGLSAASTDASSELQESNNTLNQDSQIIQSCNSIAQSSVKNTTDMFAFFTQHQVSN